MSATLTASFGTVEEAVNWSIDLLRKNGFVVKKPDLRERETPKDICARLDFCIGSLARSLARGDHPPAEITRGPSGRILFIRSTAELDAWLRARRAPGQRTTK